MLRVSGVSKFPGCPIATLGVLVVAVSCISARAATITEFPLPSDQAAPTSITNAPDGNLWFTEFERNKIGRITPQGQVTEFQLPGAHPDPLAITLGKDGNLWIVEWDRIGKMTTAGTLSEYPLPFGYNSNVLGIAPGPDGNIWFTESRCPYCDPSASGQTPNDGATIGKITPAGAISEFTLPDYHAGPRGITAGPDGNLWFTEEVGNKIGRISPSGVVVEFPLPVADSHPMGIATGSDGNLWFIEYQCVSDYYFGGCGKGIEVIGKITPAGAITEYPTSSGIGGGNGVGTVSIVEAADHNLWFTEPASNRIGRITHTGVITEFDIPAHRPANYPPIFPDSDMAPMGIANGPDGNVWFVEATLGFGGRVGKVDLGSTMATPTEATISPGFTGNWFNSSESGLGFSIEVLPGNQMLAEWYVFAPNGGQSWIVATGPIVGNTAVLQGFQPTGPGGRFLPNFDPSKLQNQPWGTLTFTFTDCNTGTASWQPTAAGYTSGSTPIRRLTMPAGLTCQ
jgi:streptogramin lyase